MPDALPPSRTVRLVLVDPAGRVLGAWAPFPVATPWWQEVEAVVTAARERHGVDVTILRLLATERPEMPGGLVTYLAEVTPPVNASPWEGALAEHPLRASYARPGGPAADLAWADRELARHGLPRVGPARQVRTWNLSSLWRLPVRGQNVWLKVVPPFFGHEGAMLARLAGRPVPRLLARDGCRLLMPEIPGQDLYGAPLPFLERMVPLLVALQRAEIGRADELLALGLPDWRGPALARAIGAVVERSAVELAEADLATLRTFVQGLAARFRALATCGIPDTLVHGDFHPGNLRGDDRALTLLDWGDSGVGHPLLDQSAFTHCIAPESVARVRALWADAWWAAVPGCEPQRAAELLAPVAAARQAVIYWRFLDGIEPSEHPYHRLDPARWLVRTAALVRGAAGVTSGP